MRSRAVADLRTRWPVVASGRPMTGSRPARRIPAGPAAAIPGAGVRAADRGAAGPGVAVRRVAVPGAAVRRTSGARRDHGRPAARGRWAAGADHGRPDHRVRDRRAGKDRDPAAEVPARAGTGLVAGTGLGDVDRAVPVPAGRDPAGLGRAGTGLAAPGRAGKDPAAGTGPAGVDRAVPGRAGTGACPGG